MRQFDSTTHFVSHGVNREPAALDALELQFFERCRRNATNVVYPRHIPVPHPVTNLQRRGLTYQSATGIGNLVPLPILGRALSLPSAACPLSGQPLSRLSCSNPGVEATAGPSIVYSQVTRNSMTHNQLIASRQRRQATRQELNTVHRQNLQRRLHQRMEAARANGNEALLHQLEKEMNLIA
ncbi:MAG: hypothetical protein F6K09_09720 [Merismopedia sp. SIO2A8]|nr:hypothetical protein [Merismopedia sp. SIO2A8]